MSLFDRVAAGLDQIGRKANQALDEGKLRMELMGARRRKDVAARDLGYVVYAQSKGTAPAEGQVDGLTRRIADADAEVEQIEARIKEVRSGAKPAGSPPATGTEGVAEPPSPPDSPAPNP
jgi:hypothetical protein